ncbi:MAG: sigma-70 family RNA polymerase sigma factor [Sphingobacterium sp.]
MENFEKEIVAIKGLKDGDTRAFNRLYQHYHKMVHANILKIVKAPEPSAEILQDVFTSLWQNRNKMSIEKPLGGWLFVVSYNMSLNFIRKKLKESLILVEEYPFDLCSNNEDNSEETIFDLQMQLLDQAVSELPRRKREVFRMCRFEGHSKKDVAENLGLSLRTVENYLKDANRTVKEYVVQKYPNQMGIITISLLIPYLQ